jgi:hypothetical protein
MNLLLIATFGLTAWAQTIDFNLDAVAAKAKEKAEITLEGSTLAQATQMAPEGVKSSLAKLSSIVLRHYEFDKPGQYSDSDLERVRKQISAGSGWSRILNTKEEHESVEIYILASQGAKPGGLLLIAAEEKELTVLQVVGSVELAHLQEVVSSTIAYDLATAGARQAAH